MDSFSTLIPPFRDFFPPTPPAYQLLFQWFKVLPLMSIVLWIPQISRLQAMGRSSLSNSRLNLPGRYAWAVAEMVGPLNLLFIVYTLPSRLLPTREQSSAASSLLGTGMPFFYHELLALLYLAHYLNRAIITPLYLAPSMSPIALPVAVLMAVFQFFNSSCLACWLVYHEAHARLVANDLPTSPSISSPSPMISQLTTNPLPLLVGIPIFLVGLYGNVSAEGTLFTLRRQAALRRARSEGKPLHNLSYAKVYVMPEPRAWFRYVMYPHYAMEWLEWTAFWLLAGLAGLGWWPPTPALWFVFNEVATMAPRAMDGVRWYEAKFGKRSVAGRKAVVPWLL